MSEADLTNNNIISSFIVYDIIIVPGIVVFFILIKKFNGIIRIAYFLGLVCFITAILHRYYIWSYTGDTSTGITYTDNMYVILTVELATFIAFIVLILIGFFIPASTKTV